MVLPFDPSAIENADRLAAFRTHYSIGSEITLLGGYRGQLNDTGERVQLQRPGTAADGDIPHLLEDEVLYDGLAPWPVDLADTGHSLTRNSETDWGNAADSWRSDVPSLGSAGFAKPPILGDSNRDGQFDGADLALAQQSGKYMSGQAAGLEEGDWNGDGFFDQLDIVAALQMGGYDSAPLAALAAGPTTVRPDSPRDTGTIDFTHTANPHVPKPDDVDWLFAGL